jgi:hypothetical protein
MLVRREDLEKLDVRLCPQCLERYTVPCAVVCIEVDADDVGHVVLFRYNRAPQGRVFYKALRCCGEREWVGMLIPAPSSPLKIGLCLPFIHESGDWRGVILIGHRALICGEFVNYLLQRYPRLQGRLLTSRTLRKAGCDLEAEIAMWQIGGDV